MEIILKKEIVDSLVDKQLEFLKLKEPARQYFKENINTDEMFKFFLDGVSRDSVVALFQELQNPQISNNEDILHYMKLMIKKDVLTAVCEALAVIKNKESDLSPDEKLNLLIDFKTIENPEFFEKILGDTLEAVVNEK